MRQKLERFDHIKVPTVFEIFEAIHATGTFQQIGGPYENADHASQSFDELSAHPELKGKKLFIVEVVRRGIVTNFNAREITPHRDGTVQ